MKIDIKNVSVIGAGILGHSIALTFAMAGYTVTLSDISESKLNDAKKNIEKSICLLKEYGAYNGSNQTHENIKFIIGLNEIVYKSDLVIEAVPEDLKLKKMIFKLLDLNCSPHTILSSNSSSLNPDEYGEEIVSKERLIGMHFFNPPYLLPLVEVIKGTKTNKQIAEIIKKILIDIGMKPVLVSKPSRGFIGNRLQFALLNEAIKIVEEGIATPEEVDIVVKFGFGRRLSVLGLFEVFDFGGWDTIAKVQPNITGNKVSSIIKEKVEKGYLGVKTGKGFYDWDENKLHDVKSLIIRTLINIQKTTTEKHFNQTVR